MERRFTIFLFSVLFLFVLNQTILSSNLPKGISITKTGNSYTINFDLPDYSLTNETVQGEDYSRLLINDYGITSDAGFPALPVISFNLFISANEIAPKIKDESLSKEIESITNKIYPAQMPWEKQYSLSDRPFVINKEYYNSAGTELPFVSISEPFIIGGIKGITITIKPFNYNPSENKLTIVKHGSFKISLANNPSTNVIHSVRYNDFLKSIFINYEPQNVSYTSNYLIITDPSYESTMSSFITYKNTLGYNVSMVNTSVTGNTCADIKNYILQRYNNPQTRPEFLLLVGDVDKIPEWIGTAPDNPHTDLYYATLEGNDIFPDCFYGRFSISNTTELANIINKTIYMESSISSLSKKGIFMASTDNYTISEGTQNFVLDSFFIPNNYAYQKLYVHTYGATTQQLINALNANQTFAIYTGHGATTYWADGPVLYQSQVQALTNTGMYPFVYSFACLTGQYQVVVCFGETWIRIPTGGSLFWGSSVSSYWDEDDILERRVFRAMFTDNLIQTAPMFWQGKIYLMLYYGGITPTIHRYFEMYNLLGDPSIYEAAFGPTIAHNQLPSTENVNGPYTVNCIITPAGSPINQSQTKIFWTRGNIFTDSVSLNNTGGNNWAANIPGNGYNAIYKYYIKAGDQSGRLNYFPGGAPGNYFSFSAMPDTIAPVITHVPLTNIPRVQWPTMVNSVVSDNIGIDSVWVKWYRNNPSTGIKEFKLNNISGYNFSALFNSDTNQVNYNDSIFYRIYAKDNSSNHNTDSTSLYTFKILPALDVCIGSGTVSVPHPFNTYWQSARTDMLYLANEITSSGGVAGYVSKIGFDIINSSPMIMSNFNIKIQSTSVNSISSFTNSGWTTVFSGNYSIPGPGVQFIDLQTPFYWNGTQNILIEVCFADSSSADATNINSAINTGKTWSQKQSDMSGCALTGGSPMDGRPNICLQINLITGKVPVTFNLPIEYKIEQNYPNPFNPSTIIKYQIPKNSFVKLVIYDVAGREVKTLVNENQLAGNHKIEFDGSTFASGVYFYKLTADPESSSGLHFSETKKLVLIK